MITPNGLEAETVRQAALEVLQAHVKLNIHGYKVDERMVLDVLLKAASEHQSIEAACAEMETVADSNTIREQVNAALTVANLRSQEAAMNQALTAWLPPGLFKGWLDIALDTHDEPFYGKTPELLAYVCRAQAKSGTTHFVRVASAYLIWRGARLTLAVTYVKPSDALTAVVKRLLARLRTLGLKWNVLYMDKGFCSTTLMDYLQTSGQAAIIACPIHGKQGGLRALCRGAKSFTTRYTFHSGTVAKVALYPARVRDRKTGNRRIQWLAYVLIHLGWIAPEAFLCYRRRFGIESSYRLARRAKALTTSRNPALRFFYLGLALLLENIWIRLRNIVARLPGPGRARLAPLHFPFRHFLHFLNRAIESIYGVVLRCPILRPQFSSAVALSLNP